MKKTLAMLILLSFPTFLLTGCDSKPASCGDAQVKNTVIGLVKPMLEENYKYSFGRMIKYKASVVKAFPYDYNKDIHKYSCKAEVEIETLEDKPLFAIYEDGKPRPTTKIHYPIIYSSQTTENNDTYVEIKNFKPNQFHE